MSRSQPAHVLVEGLVRQRLDDARRKAEVDGAALEERSGRGGEHLEQSSHATSTPAILRATATTRVPHREMAAVRAAGLFLLAPHSEVAVSQLLWRKRRFGWLRRHAGVQVIDSHAKKLFRPKRWQPSLSDQRVDGTGAHAGDGWLCPTIRTLPSNSDGCPIFALIHRECHATTEGAEEHFMAEVFYQDRRSSAVDALPPFGRFTGWDVAIRCMAFDALFSSLRRPSPGLAATGGASLVPCHGQHFASNRDDGATE
jgi:hypothetical protein